MRMQDAYAKCAAITKREARNFSLGIRLLPGPKREALTALYAFARRVDDIADGHGSPEMRRAELQACAASLADLPRAPLDDAVLTALGDAMVRYPIPKRALLELIEGAGWDAERSRYETWDELREYCLRVAGTIGVACTAVYGPPDLDRAIPLAETLGIGLQQINIMRDVAEDYAMGRIYLPQRELERFSVTEEQIAEGSVDENWRALMQLQAGRARAHLVRGFGLLDLLDRRSSLCVRALAGVYVELLGEIERADFDVFSDRRKPSTRAKLKVVGAGFTDVLRGSGAHAAAARNVRPLSGV
ncbi:MAG: phytoene/squalene synthase family protein [Gaiellaceae bacterium]